MWDVKYWKNPMYYSYAIALSAQINNQFPDTCEIQEGDIEQFELFHNEESFLNAGFGKFFGIDEVKEKMLKEGKTFFDLE